MRHLLGLNKKQKEAVLTTEGPLLILAGAGAGKTRVITCRIAEIIRQGTAPHEILAVTFTNKAAKEMRERVRDLLSSSEELSRNALPTLPFVSTFHSLGLYVIKENAKILGLPRTPAIHDRSDSLRAIKEAMGEAGVSKDEFDPRKILGRISKEKGGGIDHAAYAKSLAEGDFMPGIIATVWGKYEEILRGEKALDFDDLLLKAVKLLREHNGLCAQYQEKWKYIEVDEYQDTNRVQNEFMELLVGAKQNICAVGDIDQNIYSWRGAELKNILSFEKRFSSKNREVKIILLEENYRSTQTILRAANEIIAKNRFRRDKNLFTKNAEGEKMSLYFAYDEEDEARFIARRAQELIEGGKEPRDIAILFRANWQSRTLEEAFLERNIPYQILGTRFFERKEVKDLLSFLRLATGSETPADIKRVANVPPRGIGKVTLLKMLAGQESSISGTAGEKVRVFRALLSRAREFAKDHLASATVRFILKESGAEKFYKGGDEEDKERLENMYELVSLAARYDALSPHESVEALLEDAALATDQDELQENRNAVKLMTVHAAKGLEFDRIFISGLEEGLFPITRGMEETEEEKEEERRLFYVALTRARKNVTLSYASMRTIFGARAVSEPSTFILDIPEELLIPENPERISKTIYLD